MLTNCSICYSDDAEIDDFIPCEFCGNVFHINHLGHWVTIQQRCPVCKEIFSTEFISHLDNVSDSLNFDEELMEAFRRDLEIEEMQNREKIAKGDSAPSYRTTNEVLKNKYCRLCGNQMVTLFYKQSINHKYSTLALRPSGEPVFYCHKDQVTD